MTTQGIGLLFKRDFEHWKELFHRNKKTDRDTLRTDTVQTVQKKDKKKKRKKKKEKKWKWDF